MLLDFWNLLRKFYFMRADARQAHVKAPISLRAAYSGATGRPITL